MNDLDTLAYLMTLSPSKRNKLFRDAKIVARIMQDGPAAVLTVLCQRQYAIDRENENRERHIRMAK